jgi:hypothetical protein
LDLAFDDGEVATTTHLAQWEPQLPVLDPRAAAVATTGKAARGQMILR